MVIKSKEFYLPFVKKEQLAKDTYSFYFDRTSIDLNFLPGQYIRMTLSIKKPDERGSSRLFTIASSPLEKNHIMITTKVIQSSFKKRMMELKPKELVQFFGPMGGFVLNEEEKVDRVFLAGGIGITPFHSMITFADQKDLSIPIILIVSFSTAEEMIFYQELLSVANKNPHVKVIYTISHPEASKKRWTGKTGRISDALIKKYVPNILDPQYFIVGPPAMVMAIEEVVRGMGVGSERIFIENFTGY